VPLRIFRSRTVSVANAVQVLMVAGMFGMFFLGALYLQRVLGYDAIEVGLAFLPVALASASCRRGSRPAHRPLGGKATLLPGSRSWPPGSPTSSACRSTPSYAVDLFPAMLLLGLGAGLSFPALMTLAMSGATPEDSGLASGLVNTTQQVGGALGLAVLATLSTTRSETLLGNGESTVEALTGGYRLAFAIGAGVLLVALALAAAVLRTEAVAAVEAETVTEIPSSAAVVLDEAA
jgi:predicted MFS family arabinose efflux permease